jgi:hypothetical protein
MRTEIRLVRKPEPYMREAIVRPLLAFNNSRASQPEDYRPLVIVLSDADSGGVLGGLWGETNFAYSASDLIEVAGQAWNIAGWVARLFLSTSHRRST